MQGQSQLMALKNKILGIALVLFCMPLLLVAQTGKEAAGDTIDRSSPDTVDQVKENTSQKFQKEKNDTVYLFEDKEMHVNVLKITYDSVLYREARHTGLKAIDKDRVHKIRYNWGRLEIINENPPKRQKTYDWRKVKFLKNKRKADGLFEVKEIEAHTKGSGRGYQTPRSLETKAKTILKKKAANINAQYVLITNKAITTAFGESPSATLTATAYSTEKPEGNKHKGKKAEREKPED